MRNLHVGLLGSIAYAALASMATHQKSGSMPDLFLPDFIAPGRGGPGGGIPFGSSKWSPAKDRRRAKKRKAVKRARRLGHA